ncbi:DUF1990 family protein [Winogradskya humida]|uniref:DUF1990 domain-containing protein n=1 Tax=Winogradskya humida TaxID=113566 RepID=A0ABQ3ZS44_9ACTN|nr:DUF1990 domain-containing protein [Actinoplanes humidus]GIE21395.1 DUF1990 domain-containing protein [Actinoplanes humidus]
MQPFTYVNVGATRDAEMPAGYRHVDRDVAVEGSLDQAAERLMTWQMHRDAGLRVDAGADRAAPGVEVTLHLLVVRILCRVIYVLDEPDRRGFAYGTLAGHPEQGEEAFEVYRTAEGAVRARIRAFSRPATLLTKVGGPVATLVQDFMTGRYLRALQK